MPIPITPPIFLDFMTMCLTWEWGQAKERFADSIMEDRTVWPTQTGFTTVDKIVRILHGMKILTTKQKGALYKDRRTQSQVLRNSHVIPYGYRIQEEQSSTDRRFLLMCDIAAEVNRQRMLRNMRFYITDIGESIALELESKWAHVLRKEDYFDEIKRQSDEAPTSSGGRGAMMTHYNKKVRHET